MKLSDKRILIPASVLAVVAVAVISFLVGKNASKETDKEDLLETIHSLQVEERDAAIVKRVSQQMEDIAYQQKAISDKQRDRAEEQSKLAIQMRDKAEVESRAAREAEGQAKLYAKEAEKSAREADGQREIAISHQKMAEEQRDQANYAKSITDTLSYRTLGRTLGNLSVTQHETGNTEIANLLAYASWYYLDKYKGNTYLSESFKALSLSADAKKSSTMHKGGAVTTLIPMSDASCIAVSDYGEIELIKSIGSAGQVLFQDNTYDFRDACLVKDNVYALSIHGQLVIISLTGMQKKAKVVELNSESYVKIIKFNEKTLLFAGRKSIQWYSISNGSMSQPMTLPKTLSTIVKHGNTISLFYTDGTCAGIDASGKITPKKSLTKGVVTAAYYDTASGCLYLGHKNGDIDMINKYQRKIFTLSNHISQVTNIVVLGKILVSSAYDKTIAIWNMPMITFQNGRTLDEEMNAANAKQATQMDKKGTSSEWLTPVEYKFEGWPLVLSRISSTEVLIGTSNGMIQKMNISVPTLSNSLKNKLHRNFTNEEWNHYVGTNIPFTKFK